MKSDQAEIDRGQFQLSIDGEKFVSKDPVVTGRQLLLLAHKKPPEEHLLYQLSTDMLLEDIGLEETVDLREPGSETFITFLSDRSYRFELDSRRQDWGASKITETTLRKLAGADDAPEQSVWLERIDQEDLRLERGQWVDLTGEGVERFYTRRSLSVTVVNEDNGDEFVLVGEKQTAMSKLFEQMYGRLRVTRKPDDRLRCESSKADVFASAGLTFGQYVESGTCSCLVWLFAGGTGGASCR